MRKGRSTMLEPHRGVLQLRHMGFFWRSNLRQCRPNYLQRNHFELHVIAYHEALQNPKMDIMWMKSKIFKTFLVREQNRRRKWVVNRLLLTKPSNKIPRLLIIPKH
ncbi:hypothetical protein NPIL_492761 [Nephila pilipes]|uniref:Uncharacterized protein n=1 Tax=Nephila pilipes TaxID=299642 RepID=A0A8X6NCW5_NEPPI|nr:hypothetical protein NPIL_492761 [Nephila pilipes]